MKVVSRGGKGPASHGGFGIVSHKGVLRWNGETAYYRGNRDPLDSERKRKSSPRIRTGTLSEIGKIGLPKLGRNKGDQN